MIKHLHFAPVLAIALTLCGCHEVAVDYSSYVDPKIGSGDHGHVFVGASVPFGMVQLGPTSYPQTWDWCSGYHDSDSTLIGFSHTHLSGTGVGDLFDVTVMPVTCAVGQYSRQGLCSMAMRSREVAEPGYYSVPMAESGVIAELTATCRVGMHRYTFPAEVEMQSLVFDLENGGCWDMAIDTGFTMEGDTRISGFRHSKGWAADQRLYFAAEFSRPMEAFTVVDSLGRYARVDFASDAEPVMIKVAVSPVSVDGAWRNLEAELPGWDFDAVRQDARKAWNRELGRVRIETADAGNLTKFYTALYHWMISPSVFCDVDSLYRGADKQVHVARGFVPYTVLSLWDTYRSALPLMSLLMPDRYADVINTMIDISEQQGRLPVWHLWANETNCMVGDPGIIAVADAIVRHTDGVDSSRAMAALLATAAHSERGRPLRARHGYIPCDSMKEAIAFDMEYAIADGAISRAAAGLGFSELADSFAVLSQSWRRYFDSSTGFVRGRMADGSWRTPFDPRNGSYSNTDYCEGNAWQYTWLAPHDLQGYVELMGSREAVVERLDSLFAADSEITGLDAASDITGLIGQYAHGNEPSHHVAYLYTLLGQQPRTGELVRRIMDEMYTTRPEGLCGNEDAGAMSAWYIFSALGFYPVEPGSGRYVIGAPLVDSAEIELSGGVMRVTVHYNSPVSHEVERVMLNGCELAEFTISHADFQPGSHLEIYMK